MLVAEAKLHKLEFDRSRYAASMRRWGEKLLQDAARAWLEAVIPKVPIATGMAQASLRPLGRLLKPARRITLIGTPRKGWPGHTISDGEDQGQATLLIRANGSGPTSFEFNWGTAVAHFIALNDTSNPDQGTRRPWKAIQAGNTAFNKVMNAGFDKVPHPLEKKFIRAKKVVD